MLLGFTQQLQAKRLLVYLRLAAHNPAQQRRPFVSHLSRHHQHPKDDRRQGALRQAMEMFAQPTFEAWTPETGHIHTHHLVPCVAPHTPLILARHEELPILQQFIAVPGATAQSRPTPPHFLRRKPLAGQGAEDGTATLQKRTTHHHPQEAHQGHVRPHRHRLHHGADCMYSVFYGV